MGSVNHGSQDITIEYYEEATSFDVNKRNVDIVPRGIYSGGHLTRVSDTEVTLSSFTAEIGDDDIQISVKTSAIATLNSSTLDSGDIDPSTPFLVLRWSYLAQQNNYVEVHAIASASAAQSNDIIIGECVFSGSTLTGFHYADRTFLNTQDLFLKVETDSGLYVWLRAGRIHNSSGYLSIHEQRVGPFSVPASPNSRIDLVYIATNGTVTIEQGTAAVSPSAPSYDGKLVVAEVTIVNGDTSIPASQIVDVRSFLTGLNLTEVNPPDIVSILGSRVSIDSLGSDLVINSVYRAESDGQLVVSQAGGPDVQVKVGSANPPTSIVARHTWSSSTTYGTISLLIAKNEYVQITGNIAGTPDIWWQPIGSGDLVKQ